MKTAPFYSFVISFLAGILAFSYVPADPRALALAAFACGLLAALAGIWSLRSASQSNERPRSFRLARAACVTLFAASLFSIGAARIASVMRQPHPLDAEVGKKASLVGTVCGYPSGTAYEERFCFEPEGSADRALISISGAAHYAYGDVIEATGRLERPKNFLAYEDGPEFDYSSYLEAKGIRYLMKNPKVARSGENRGAPIVSWLYALRARFVATMRQIIPRTESAVLAALLVGDRDSIPKAVSDAFRSAGLIHVLVLSGFHVTLVAETLMRTLSFLPPLVGRSLGALSIVAFALMTGASATTLRATAMALAAILARSGARRYSAPRALLLAAVAMCAFEPRILAFDVSFELSAIATLGLIVLSPLMNDFLAWARIPNALKLREMLAVTLSAQIFTAPFIAYEMGQISAVAIVSNPAVIPAVPYAMLLGFWATAVGLASRALAGPIALAATFALRYVVSATERFASLPFSLIRMSAGVYALALSYLAYTAILIWLSRRRSALRRSAN